MCEILSQQLQVVLESATAPPEDSIFSEVEMKNMARVVGQVVNASLKSTVQIQQVNRALYNQDAVHITALATLEPNPDQ